MVVILPEVSRTLNEYLLVPNLTTEDCTPDNVDLSTPIVRHPVGGTSSLRIAVPMVSAIMQAVSSPRLAISLAQTGGLSFVHQNQGVAEQAESVSAVKRHKAGFRHSDINTKPSATLGEVSRLLRAAELDIAVVTDDGTASGRFVGLISTADFHPHRHDLNDTVESRMRPAAGLVTAPPTISLSRRQHPDLGPPPGPAADRHRRRAPRLDRAAPRLRAAQAVPQRVHRRRQALPGRRRDQHPRLPRPIPALVEAGADVLCIDSSDGYSVWQRKALQYAVRELHDAVPVGAGNVVDGRGFRYLAEAGAAFVKVGIGGGSICITRDQKGIGRGQASALIDVVAERDRYAAETGVYVPVCCDGGLLADYHMAIALALGADFIMLGRYFARFDESPSNLVNLDGQMFKEYWGEGSQRARNVARYDQGETELPFEEGVDGYVPYAGSLYPNVARTVSKLRATMVSCGAITLPAFHRDAVLVQVSQQSYEQNGAEVRLRSGSAAADSERDVTHRLGAVRVGLGSPGGWEI